MGYSKKEKTGRTSSAGVHSKPMFAEWFASQQGNSNGATKD